MGEARTFRGVLREQGINRRPCYGFCSLTAASLELDLALAPARRITRAMETGGNEPRREAA